MRLKNFFVQESFIWDGQPEDAFREGVLKLAAIFDYLHQLDEAIYGSDELYYQEILPGTQIVDFFSLEGTDPLHDEKELLRRSVEEMRTVDEGESFDCQIGLQLYALAEKDSEAMNLASDIRQYLFCRRNILEGLGTACEFAPFMISCFPDIVFSDSIEGGLHSIPDFAKRDVRKAIVHDLGVLNDEALDLYREYYPNTGKMCQALGAKVLACSIDAPEHNKYLYFSFSYMDNAENIQIKSVLCSPHTKLIRRDSNLRIYFAWQDADVGTGQKVLVGRIGGHPYPKKQ